MDRLRAGRRGLVSSAGGRRGRPASSPPAPRESGKTHGLAEYIAQEEMGRSHGFWWSPTAGGWPSKRSTRPTSRSTASCTRAKTPPARAPRKTTATPSPGRPTPTCAWAWYLGRAASRSGWTWATRPKTSTWRGSTGCRTAQLAAQIENREQTALDLVRFDPRTGRRQHCCCARRSEVWINLHDLFRPLDRRMRAASSGPPSAAASATCTCTTARAA